ncbi:MAG: metallophosphatase, partial [Sodaliphilus sp.]|nr:metallophosphatase [Sodaliphilus sp.]
MKIQYASDIHLEFPDNSKWLSQNPLTVVGDILVLSGDMLLFG